MLRSLGPNIRPVSKALTALEEEGEWVTALEEEGEWVEREGETE